MTSNFQDLFSLIQLLHVYHSSVILIKNLPNFIFVWFYHLYFFFLCAFVSAFPFRAKEFIGLLYFSFMAYREYITRYETVKMEL